MTHNIARAVAKRFYSLSVFSSEVGSMIRQPKTRRRVLDHTIVRSSDHLSGSSSERGRSSGSNELSENDLDIVSDFSDQFRVSRSVAFTLEDNPNIHFSSPSAPVNMRSPIPSSLSSTNFLRCFLSAGWYALVWPSFFSIQMISSSDIWSTR